MAEFIKGIALFSVKGDRIKKLKCMADAIRCPHRRRAVAFKIYDIDGDGFISNGELFQVLKLMVGSNLKESQLQQIVDKTILYTDKDNDGKISFDEFCAVCGGHARVCCDAHRWSHRPRCRRKWPCPTSNVPSIRVRAVQSSHSECHAVHQNGIRNFLILAGFASSSSLSSSVLRLARAVFDFTTGAAPAAAVDLTPRFCAGSTLLCSSPALSEAGVMMQLYVPGGGVGARSLDLERAAFLLMPLGILAPGGRGIFDENLRAGGSSPSHV